MKVVFLDLETKKSFHEVPERDPKYLGVSFVGLFRRPEEDFLGFFEEELTKLWPILEKAERIVGYNIRKFDFSVLNPYYSGDLYRLPVFDLMDEIKKNLGGRLRLDNLAKATLGAGKAGSGWDALRFYQEGNLEKLKKYCLRDVEVTRDLYDYAMKEGKLKYFNPAGEIKEIVLRIKDLDYVNKVQMTLGV
jgi:DEAD/DEAH box helicase domain-containing protein